MRNYAESLAGKLDRSYYNTQRDVANQTYKTNWENLQNQYKNLTERLRIQQEQANTDFANGLGDISESSFSRMANVNKDLVSRGLDTSGVRNMYEQADTIQKGKDVKELLGKSNDIAVDIANQLSVANQNYASNQAELNKNLGDALGEIGAAETAAQMSYNKGLADIIGAAEEREAANAAAKRAASYDENDEVEEAYRRQAILETLMDDTLTEEEKRNVLGVIYNVSDAKGALDNYYQADRKKAYGEQLDKAKGELGSMYNLYDEAENWGVLTGGVEDEDIKATIRDKKILYLYMSGDPSVSKFQADNAFENLYSGGSLSKKEREGYKNAMAARRGENEETVPKYYQKKINQIYEQYSGYAKADEEYKKNHTEDRKRYEKKQQEIRDLEALYNKDYGSISEYLYGK